jgi:hypothetical protein
VDQDKQVIKTSTVGWLESLAKAYKERQAVILQDDAQIGIDPKSDTLLRMVLKAKLSPREIAGVVISLGVSVLGAWLVVMAVLDPEPYSKVAAVIATGAAMVLGGGFLAVRILTDVKPPNVVVGPRGFEIYWD